MNKKLLVCVLVVVVALAAGCNGISGGGDGKPKDTRTGTKGLVMSFIPGSPPNQFLGEGTLMVGIQIKNAGTTSIESSNGFGGNVYLSGFDSSIVHFEKNADGINLLGGRNLFDPEGETEIKEFPATVTLGTKTDTYKTTILATACYSYETLANPLVCVDSDPFGINTRQKACTTKDVSLSGGQGAPVAVTKVELSPSKEKLRFKISIANVGGGTVYNMNSQNCNPYSSGLTPKERDQVTIAEVSVANINLLSFGACKPLTNGNINLIGGKRDIICELDLGSSGLANSPAFSTPMVIRLRYGYSSSISKNVEIIRSP